ACVLALGILVTLLKPVLFAMLPCLFLIPARRFGGKGLAQAAALTAYCRRVDRLEPGEFRHRRRSLVSSRTAADVGAKAVVPREPAALLGSLPFHIEARPPRPMAAPLRRSGGLGFARGVPLQRRAIPGLPRGVPGVRLVEREAEPRLGRRNAGRILCPRLRYRPHALAGVRDREHGVRPRFGRPLSLSACPRAWHGLGGGVPRRPPQDAKPPVLGGPGRKCGGVGRDRGPRGDAHLVSPGAGRG